MPASAKGTVESGCRMRACTFPCLEALTAKKLAPATGIRVAAVLLLLMVMFRNWESRPNSTQPAPTPPRGTPAGSEGGRWDLSDGLLATFLVNYLKTLKLSRRLYLSWQRFRLEF